jgi:hypothetical protein
LKSGMGVRLTKSQDLEARHDRNGALCHAGGYHDVCGGGGGGIELDAVARGVLDDAAGYGWADGAEDGIGAGHGAVGAGVFDDAVSGWWCGYAIGRRIASRGGNASGLKA